jgi:hypothetical protein
MENASVSSTINTGRETYEFKPLKRLYQLFFWFIIATMLFEIPSVFNPQFSTSIIDRLAPNMTLILIYLFTSLISAGLSITAMVFFFIWVYRACKNLHAPGYPKPKYSPGWAVGWFFIPAVNLVMNLLVMLEIQKKSAFQAVNTTGDARQEMKASPIWVILWWAMSLVSLGVGIAFFVFFIIEIINRFGTYPVFDWMYPMMEVYSILAFAFSVIGIVFRILMLRQITDLQEASFRKINANT